MPNWPQSQCVSQEKFILSFPKVCGFENTYDRKERASELQDVPEAWNLGVPSIIRMAQAGAGMGG